MTTGSNLERLYSVPEIAKAWGMSPATTRKYLQNEPGVLTFGAPYKRGKRAYTILRVPESVLRRVAERRANGLSPS